MTEVVKAIPTVSLPPELAEHLKLGHFTGKTDENGRALYPTRLINETVLQVTDLLRSATGSDDCVAKLQSVFGAMEETAKAYDPSHNLELEKRVLLTEVMFTLLGHRAKNYPPKSE